MKNKQARIPLAELCAASYINQDCPSLDMPNAISDFKISTITAKCNPDHPVQISLKHLKQYSIQHGLLTDDTVSSRFRSQLTFPLCTTSNRNISIKVFSTACLHMTGVKNQQEISTLVVIFQSLLEVSGAVVPPRGQPLKYEKQPHFCMIHINITMKIPDTINLYELQNLISCYQKDNLDSFFEPKLYSSLIVKFGNHSALIHKSGKCSILLASPTYEMALQNSSVGFIVHHNYSVIKNMLETLSAQFYLPCVTLHDIQTLLS